ncbi:disulfide isomerase DsbC N-terminal domain-containing protein [Marinobacter sp. F3R08]|uniref:disulfide isomerase DsbC N-terminal domain-containing protein n=1 Tax=Marinobacter sp. F3R08 TaxID=2841559 RepID=UPI001C0975B8|nr:disulfide isomerase DsbC N-terminal domain-containing protein [Marinobacter sp. F3R08]MBU2952241.1 thioredoxin fold domain-containing protein [Marinobacter sp. F3R08]
MNPSKIIQAITVVGTLLMISCGVSASNPQKLKQMGLTPKSIVQLPIDGLVAYETENGGLFFMSSDGRYVFSGGQVSDVWNGSVLKTGTDASRSAESIPLENMNIDFDQLDALEIGTGNKVVHVITDPACPACKKLGDQMHQFTDEYTFKILALPALGRMSEDMAKRIACESDRDAAAQALLNGTANQLPAPENCNLDAYKQALLVADYIRVREVPFLIGPNDLVNRGLPKDLGGWLQKASSFLPPQQTVEAPTNDQKAQGKASLGGSQESESLNNRLRNAIN